MGKRILGSVTHIAVLCSDGIWAVDIALLMLAHMAGLSSTLAYLSS